MERAESETQGELTHRSAMEMTSAIAMATMTPVLNAEFVDEPPLTGRPLLGSAELTPGQESKSALQGLTA